MHFQEELFIQRIVCFLLFHSLRWQFVCADEDFEFTGTDAFKPRFQGSLDVKLRLCCFLGFCPQMSDLFQLCVNCLKILPSNVGVGSFKMRILWVRCSTGSTGVIFVFFTQRYDKEVKLKKKKHTKNKNNIQILSTYIIC